MDYAKEYKLLKSLLEAVELLKDIKKQNGIIIQILKDIDNVEDGDND